MIKIKFIPHSTYEDERRAYARRERFKWLMLAVASGVVFGLIMALCATINI